MDAYERVDDLLDELRGIIETGYDDAKSESNWNDWIDVNDMLPGENYHDKIVLAVVDYAEVMPVLWDHYLRAFRVKEGCSRTRFSHWMPLPPPPEYDE